MENFVFSVNATFPIFLVMLAGWVLRRFGMLTQGFVDVANRFNFYVTLPILLFTEISTMSLSETFDPAFFFYCMGATAVGIGIIWALSVLFIRDKKMLGAFVQGCYRGSPAVMGVAFVMNMYGSAGASPLMIVASVPLFNIFAVLILTIHGDGGGFHPAQLKKALLGVCKNPILWGILVGLVFSVAGWRFPTLIDKTLGYFADMSTPIALIAIGVGVQLGEAFARWKQTLLAAFIKLIALPGVFLTLALFLGFQGDQLVALVAMLGLATTPSAYIMAKNMKNDAVLTSGIIVVTTLLSSVTVTGWIFLLRTLGRI